MSAFTKAAARVRAHRMWLFLLATVIAPFAFFGTLAVTGAPIALLWNVVQVGALVAWTRWLSDRRGMLRADEGGLWLDDVRLVARKRVRHAYVLERDGEMYVRIVRRVGSTEVAVAGQEEADALLAAMRLDPSHSVAQYVVQHGTYRGGWTRLAALFGLGIVALPALMLASLPLAGGAFALWYAALLYFAISQVTRVAVGADGVRLHRYLHRARFIPFGAMASAETADGRDVVVRLRDGEVIRLHHQMGKGWSRSLNQHRADEAKKLVERIEAQIEHHGRSAPDVTALARGERTTSDWIRDVARTSDEHASFRANAIPPDALWRVVEDPAAGTTARAGAALALRSRLDDDGRARLRVLADACAAPKLRVALETAATEDEAALEAAYDELRDERRA